MFVFQLIMSVANTLYKRQKQVLDFISEKIEDKGFAPTLTEIADHFGLSSLATVHEHLAVLEKKGLIRRYKGAVRGIEMIEMGPLKEQSIELPILGFIACGSPLEPYTDPNATLPVNSKFVNSKYKSFVLQAKGDSMIEDGILHGDYLVIKEQNDAYDGDIVVAVLNNGFATLKRYYKEANRVRLQPANSTMQPMYVTDLEIKGKVVAVIRQFQ